MKITSIFYASLFVGLVLFSTVISFLPVVIEEEDQDTNASVIASKTTEDSYVQRRRQELKIELKLAEIYQTMKADGLLPQHFAKCLPAYPQQVCESGQCTSQDATVFTLLGFTLDLVEEETQFELSRCDAKGCDTYNATTQESGIFQNWQTTEPRGFILRMQTQDLDLENLQDKPYTEVAIAGTTVYINTGYCSFDFNP